MRKSIRILLARQKLKLKKVDPKSRDKQALPTQEFLKEWFDYNPETGVFLWKKQPPHRKAHLLGEVAGSQDTRYVYILLPRLRSPVGAHRLAWIFVYGSPASMQIDHIDNNPMNNAIENLRLATHAQNQRNAKAKPNNISGLKGAHFRPRCRANPWCSAILVDGRRIYLGNFKTAQEAHEAYASAAKKYFGEFARAA